MTLHRSGKPHTVFDRHGDDGRQSFTVMGKGDVGGKAAGLALLKEKVLSKIDDRTFSHIRVDIPRMVVITSTYFDAFLEDNKLRDIATSDFSDERIAHHFQQADLPPTLLGDLWSLISRASEPLAIRSSSLLEDAMFEPFAGIYGTKMIPNNRMETNVRFRQLTEAIKFVYASTFFAEAKSYIEATSHRIEEEKMCIIIQEVIGNRFGEYFFPVISGVGRSYNFYPSGRAKPEHGVVDLALGLGKSIVDGGFCWNYSPAFPRMKPPYGSTGEMLRFTQNAFWAISMGHVPLYDPIHETEYMVRLHLDEADRLGVLRHIVSTYDPQSDRINIGYDGSGPKLVTFSPMLDLEVIPLNDCIRRILTLCEEALEHQVEIEFAVTFDRDLSQPARFGLLQARPMVVSDAIVTIESAEMTAPGVRVASENVMGNGVWNDLMDVVFVKPDVFDAKYTREIALELEVINRGLIKQGTRYVLIGFGRWGSSDHWLGIPVNWGQISGAKVLVEATLPNMIVDLSQGSHFFHNLSSFQVGYFALRYEGPYRIDWDWLMQQEIVSDHRFTRHIRLTHPLVVKLDGRQSRGLIYHGEAE
ncbi:hypothetical protein JXA80_07085 [bacterium]|nr:hypothetical protein [candidate division CSSED10-310 bacterium]